MTLVLVSINTRREISFKSELRSQTSPEYSFFDPQASTMVHMINFVALISLVAVFSLFTSITAIPISIESTPTSSGSETSKTAQNDVLNIVPLLRRRSNWSSRQWYLEGLVGDGLQNVEFGTSAIRPKLQ
ncbi:hypothetical protein QCA50_019850 [Cerrena zonata]|uniref:Transmembrane protein n=1 Tax=Cerrena zonata TaxID=2478898 RepID=A0AAW0FA25_9APHY